MKIIKWVKGLFKTEDTIKWTPPWSGYEDIIDKIGTLDGTVSCLAQVHSLCVKLTELGYPCELLANTKWDVVVYVQGYVDEDLIKGVIWYYRSTGVGLIICGEKHV